MYSNLVQRCFNDCVSDFTSKSLLGKEEGCVLRCVDKFLKELRAVGRAIPGAERADGAAGGCWKYGWRWRDGTLDERSEGSEDMRKRVKARG